MTQKRHNAIVLSALEEARAKAYLVKLLEGTDTYILELDKQNVEPFRFDRSYSAEDGFDKTVELVTRYKKIVAAFPVDWLEKGTVVKTFFDRFTDSFNSENEMLKRVEGSIGIILRIAENPNVPAEYGMVFQSVLKNLKMEYGGFYKLVPWNEWTTADELAKIEAFRKLLLENNEDVQ